MENFPKPIIVPMIIVIWIKKETAEIKEVNYLIVLNKNSVKFPPGFPLPNCSGFENCSTASGTRHLYIPATSPFLQVLHWFRCAQPSSASPRTLLLDESPGNVCALPFSARVFPTQHYPTAAPCSVQNAAHVPAHPAPSPVRL